MTIEEISSSLPNGFHDSEICSLHLDYERAEASLLMDIDFSSPNGATAESTRQGILKLKGVLYFVIEAPGVNVGEDENGQSEKLWVTGDSSDFSVLKGAPQLPVSLPEGSFRHWFFLSNLNCFMYVAAREASFQWWSSTHMRARTPI